MGEESCGNLDEFLDMQRMKKVPPIISLLLVRGGLAGKAKLDSSCPRLLRDLSPNTHSCTFVK